MGRAAAERRPAPPRSQVPRGCMIAIVISSALVVAAIILALAVQGSAARRVECEIAALRAAGKPVTAAEIVPPPVAAADNAAPLYLQAFAAVPKRSPDPYSETDWDNAASVAVLEQCLRKDTAMQETLNAATRLSGCRFAAGPQYGLSTSHPEYAQMRELARVCMSAAFLSTLQGDTEAGAEWVRRGLVLSRHVSHEGETMACLVAFAADAMALKAAERVVAAGPVPLASARGVSAELQAVDYMAACAAGFADERARALDLYESVRLNPASNPLASSGAPAGTLTPTQSMRELALTVAEVAYRRSSAIWADELRYLKLTGEVDRLLPYPWRDTHLRWAAMETQPGVLYGLSIAAQMEPSYMGRLVQKRDAVFARRGLLQTALALNRYKAGNGAYPKALSEVRIGGLPIPEDVFSGKPFVYRKAGESFVLYSLGTNLRDDGGKDDPESGDIVWEVAPRSLAKPSSRTQTESGKHDAH